MLHDHLDLSCALHRFVKSLCRAKDCLPLHQYEAADATKVPRVADESLAMCARVPKWNVAIDHPTENRQCRLVMSG